MLEPLHRNPEWWIWDSVTGMKQKWKIWFMIWILGMQSVEQKQILLKISGELIFKMDDWDKY